MNEQYRSITPLKITQERVRGIIASEWYQYLAHYDLQAERHRECGGAGCALCGDQAKPHVLYYAVMELHDRTLRLICLRKRHSELVHVLRTNYQEGIGAELELYKRGSAPNSPIQADYLGDWDVEPVHADAFMTTVLLPPLMRKAPTLRAADPIKGPSVASPQSGTSALER